jgi:hypothetical protein
MAEYLPPTNVSELFNVDDYKYQDGFIAYRDADQRYLRPIQKLNQKTSGLSYNDNTQTLNISKTINVANLTNTVESAIRNNGAFGESVAIGSNLVVGKNIVNSGDIHTNSIYAKNLLIRDAVIENTILTKASIDNIPISSQSISFISTFVTVRTCL